MKASEMKDLNLIELPVLVHGPFPSSWALN